MDEIRIFVEKYYTLERFCDPLVKSITKFCSGFFKITWIDPGLHADSPLPLRFMVPEYCNFEGKAIYTMVDSLVLRDIRWLWERIGPSAFQCVHGYHPDVMLINCSAFKDVDLPRTIDVNRCLKNLSERKLIAMGPYSEWRCSRTSEFSESTGLIRFGWDLAEYWAPYGL